MREIFLSVVLAGSVLYTHAQPGRGYAHDAVHDKYEKDNAANKQKGMDWMANAMNGKTEASYTFTTAVNMHMTSYKNGEKKEESDMKYYLNKGQKYFGIKPSDEKRRKDDMFMIYDNKNNSMVMLNEKEKTGMAMNINAFMSAKAQAGRGAGTGNTSTKCAKTGKTKTIQGHPCFEYQCTDAERNTRSEFWIATDLNIDIAQSMSRGPFSALGSASGAGGFMMEANIYKNDQMEMKMEVTEIDTHAGITKTIGDYKMGMSGMK